MLAARLAMTFPQVTTLETTLGQMAPPRPELPPDSGGILKECPLLGGTMCPNVVSRVEGKEMLAARLAMTFPQVFFFTRVTGPRRPLSLKLRDTRVYEPQIRARLGTTTHFCEVVVLMRRRRCSRPASL